MNTANINKVTLELLYVPFHVYMAEVAVAYVQTEFKTYAFCFTDRDQLVENIRKNGVGAERLRGALIEKANQEYVIIDVEKSSERLFFNYILGLFKDVDERSAISLTGGKLKEFWDKPEAGAIEDQLSNKTTDDLIDALSDNDEPAPKTSEGVFAKHGLFDETDWSFDGDRDIAILTHLNGTTVFLEDLNRREIHAHVELTEKVYNELVKVRSHTVDVERLSRTIASIANLASDEIIINPDYTVNKEIEVTGEPIKLKFDALPYLITNTNVNYDLGKVDLRRVCNEFRLQAADLNNPNCLGVLLDFSDPVTSLKMLDVLKRTNCNIYIIQETTNGPEIVTYCKSTGERRRRR